MKTKKPRVIAVHLLNDFSGSPFVFSQALQALKEDGHEIHLLTATPSGNGFLSGLSVIQHHIFYKWTRSKWMTLFYFLINQLFMFFKVLFLSEKGDLIYINTMLPFGAAIAARIRRCKVIYHIHEVSVQPYILKKFLLSVIKYTAQTSIYVSKCVRDRTSLRISNTVIYNALPQSFEQRATEYKICKPEQFTVLMLCSLKKYKGVFEFLQCAMRLPEIKFELVLNASHDEIDSFFKGANLPLNLKLYPAQSDVHPFYERASVVLNLSLPTQWIETFGMTALEAMYYKRPVIVPPVGGITEIVENGINGYRVDANNISEVVEKIKFLHENKMLYKKISDAAYVRAHCFTQARFGNDIVQLVNNIFRKKDQKKFPW